MTLYNDEILTDCKIKACSTATVKAYSWNINHSWTDWAIEINQKLILN